MRSHANPCWGVVLANVRKQKKHEHRSSLRSQIDAPIEVRSGRGGWLIGRKARIHMPACICRIVGMRKPDWKSSKALPRNPSAHANQLVERRMQNRRIHRLAKRLLRKVSEPDDWTSPCLSVVGIATGGTPKDRACFGRGL